MKSLKYYSPIVFMLISHGLWAQEIINIDAFSLKLEIQGEDGTNGSSIAFNPKSNMYYSAIAGNPSYPLETFNENGINVHSAEVSSDIRGIWYNSKAKSLQGNCYDNGGIVTIGLNSNQYATGGNKVLFEGRNQPGVNSCGALDVKRKEVVYYDFGNVIGYNIKTGNKGKVNLKLDIPILDENVNSTTLIYTGQSKMEYGILDHYNKKVLLFNAKSGEHTATVSLPSDAPTHSSFRFSFANGYVFLYNVDSRTWYGYKAF